MNFASDQTPVTATCSRRRLSLLAALFSVVHLHAGTLETLDGKSFAGNISLANGAFLLARDGAVAESFALTSVRRVSFTERGAATVAPAQPTVWHGQSVGAVGVRGSFSQSNEVIRVTTTGTTKRFADGRFCVWQPLGKQGEITAFIPAPSEIAKEGQRYRFAAVELLASLEPVAPRVSLLVESGRTVIVQSRTSAGKERSKRFSVGGKGVWLRLVRNDFEVVAFMSADGEAWKRLETEFVALPETAHAALAVSGARTDLEISVPFACVQVTHRGAQASPAKPLLLTRLGSALRGDYLGTDGSVVRWASLGREWNVSLVNVGRLVFQPEATSLMKRIPPGRPGVLFASGDFVDGELLRSDKTRVTISSVLFGIRSFPVDGEIIAVFVRDAVAGEGKFRVTTQDGGVLLASELVVKPDGIVLRAPGLGEVQLPLAELREVTR